MDFKLNQLSKEIHIANAEKGFYDEYLEMQSVLSRHGDPKLVDALDRVFDAQRLALVHSEASEAVEARRKDKMCSKIFNENILPETRHMGDEEFKTFYETHIKGTEEEEIADTQIRIFDYAGFKKMDLDFHIEAKLRYNALRPYKHGKKM